MIRTPTRAARIQPIPTSSTSRSRLRSACHYPEWPDDDIYEEAPPLTRVVHTLEHGRVLIWLNPTLTDDQRAQFKALYEEDPYHVIMLPREELTGAVRGQRLDPLR